MKEHFQAKFGRDLSKDVKKVRTLKLCASCAVCKLRSEPAAMLYLFAVFTVPAPGNAWGLWAIYLPVARRHA